MRQGGGVRSGSDGSRSVQRASADARGALASRIEQTRRQAREVQERRNPPGGPPQREQERRSQPPEREPLTAQARTTRKLRAAPPDGAASFRARATSKAGAA